MVVPFVKLRGRLTGLLISGLGDAIAQDGVGVGERGSALIWGNAKEANSGANVFSKSARGFFSTVDSNADEKGSYFVGAPHGPLGEHHVCYQEVW